MKEKVLNLSLNFLTIFIFIIVILLCNININNNISHINYIILFSIFIFSQIFTFIVIKFIRNNQLLNKKRLMISYTLFELSFCISLFIMYIYSYVLNLLNVINNR